MATMAKDDQRRDTRSYPSDTVTLERLSHPDHIALYRYWLDRKPKGGLPRRRDFDPVDVPRMLPRIALIAAEPDGDRFRYRYRLAGTEIVRRAGRDPTGKAFEDLYRDDYLASANALYDSLRESGEPHLSQRVFPIADGAGFLRYDRLILPFATDGATPDLFLLLIVVIEQTVLPRENGRSF